MRTSPDLAWPGREDDPDENHHGAVDGATPSRAARCPSRVQPGRAPTLDHLFVDSEGVRVPVGVGRSSHTAGRGPPSAKKGCYALPPDSPTATLAVRRSWSLVRPPVPRKDHCGSSCKPEEVQAVPSLRRLHRFMARRNARKITVPAQQFFQETSDWNTLASEDLAKAYVQHYLDSGALTEQSRARADFDRPFHISVASDESSLDILTRRAPLVADQLIITHEASTSHVDPRPGDIAKAGQYLLSRREYETKGSSIFGGQGRSFFDAEVVEQTYVHCSGFGALGDYLRAVEPMLQSGLITYIPRVSIHAQEFDGFPGWPTPNPASDVAADLFVANRRIVDVVGRQHKANLLRPVLTLDLPYLEGAQLGDYARILVEEGRALSIIQDHLRPKLLEITATPDSDEFHTRMAVLSSEVAEGVRAVTSDMRLTARRNAVQVSGASLAVCTAALLAVDAAALVELASTLGVSGGVWGLVNALQQGGERRAEVRDRPYYFLWVMDRRGRQV